MFPQKEHAIALFGVPFTSKSVLKKYFAILHLHTQVLLLFPKELWHTIEI